jgi:integrase
MPSGLNLKPSVPILQFQRFINDTRHAVEARGLQWNIPLDVSGCPLAERDWDLRKLNGSHQRHVPGTGGFAIDAQLRELAIGSGWPEARLPAGQVLPVPAQEFIKALIAHCCLIGRTAGNTQILAKAAKRLFSSTSVAPWNVTREHFEALFSLKSWSDKAKRDFCAVAKIIDEQLLSTGCPVQPHVRTTSEVALLPTLNTRAGGEKLPGRDALFELTRIVFQETPRTFNDAVTFAILRIAVLTGLRITEVLTLPLDCLVWDEHIDVVTGKSAADIGGTGRSLRLSYYGEKQRDGAPDLLIEMSQHVPARFEDLVVATVNEVISLTRPLRTVLEKQSFRRDAFPGSDIRTFRTSSGKHVGTWQRLFLTFPAAVPFPLDVPVDDSAAINTPIRRRIYIALGGSNDSRALSLFRKYGASPAREALFINPHSLRHLMNTELFRQNVSDTVITHHFGRSTVAQSYEYDHRSLAEKLKFVQLPPVSSSMVPPGSPQELVAKMVVSGIAAESHVGRSFRRIQAEHGDEAAFTWLTSNSDGFHVTPYGFCTNSFSVNPCARHLKCFDDCRHFTASGLPEHRVTLERLREKLITMKLAAEAKPATAVARKNQIAHAGRLIRGVSVVLAAQPGSIVFPDGVDYANPCGKDVFR